MDAVPEDRLTHASGSQGRQDVVVEVEGMLVLTSIEREKVHIQAILFDGRELDRTGEDEKVTHDVFEELDRQAEQP